MLDGRNGILLGGCFLAVSLAACGGPGDVGATAADVTQPAVTVPDATVETLPDEIITPEEQPTLDPTTLGDCDGPAPSARCAADPATFSSYGIAAILTSLELLDDTSCCVDFTDDGEADNALGEGFAAIDKLDELNEELRDSLLNGSQTILLEVEGLDDVQDDDDISVHVFGGHRLSSSPSSATVELDPATIDRGVAPLFSFDDARIVGGRLIANKGTMELEASFGGVLLKPSVHDVSVSARIDSASASGMVLRDGEIGGRLELSEVLAELNAVAAGCDCLGLQRPLVNTENCAKPDLSTCESEGRAICAAVVEVCPILDIIASNLADVDADGDGVVDSISLGALFEADAATISGVMR